MIGRAAELMPNSAAFKPPTARFEMTRFCVPGLLTVIDWAALEVFRGWLPKLTLVGFRLMPGPGEMPVPVSGTVCGLPLALSLMLNVAERILATVGEKVTPALMLLPGATVAGSAGGLRAKSPGFAPESARFEITRLPVPLFCKVIVVELLVVPTVWFPKAALLGLTVIEGTTPLPDSAKV